MDRYYSKKTVITNAGLALTVKHRQFMLSDDRLTAAQEVVTKAGYWVIHALSLLNETPLAKDVKKALQRTFLTFSPNAEALKQIKDTLILVQYGICNPAGLNLKIAKYNPDRQLPPNVTANQVNGYVVPYDQNRTVWGDIHLKATVLTGDRKTALVAFIHEASHKFASTADFGDKGYTRDSDGMFKEAGLTKAEALNNAESYARFVYHLCT